MEQKMQKNLSRPFAIRIDQDHEKKIRSLAFQKKLPVSWFIRQAIAFWLENEVGEKELA